jgi:hypothetical protein
MDEQTAKLDTGEELAFNEEILSEFGAAKDNELVAVVASDGKTSHGLFVDMESLDTKDHDTKGAIFAYHDLTKPIALSLGSKKVSRGKKNLLIGKGAYSSVPFVQDIRTMMSEGIINCTSFTIGFSWENMKERDGGKGEYDVFKARMSEWSVLAGWTQANKDAKITKYSEQFSQAVAGKFSQESIDTLFPNNFLFTSFQDQLKKATESIREEFKKDIDKLTKELVSFGKGTFVKPADEVHKKELLDSLKEISALFKT